MSLFGVEDRLAGERLPGLLTPSTDSGRQTDSCRDRQVNWLRLVVLVLLVELV